MSIEYYPTKNPVEASYCEPVRANARLILESSLTTKGNPDKLYYVVETDNLGHWKTHKMISIPWPSQQTLEAICAYNRGENVDLSGVPEELK